MIFEQFSNFFTDFISQLEESTKDLKGDIAESKFVIACELQKLTAVKTPKHLDTQHVDYMVFTADKKKAWSNLSENRGIENCHYVDVKNLAEIEGETAIKLINPLGSLSYPHGLENYIAFLKSGVGFYMVKKEALQVTIDRKLKTLGLYLEVFAGNMGYIKSFKTQKIVDVRRDTHNFFVGYNQEIFLRINTADILSQKSFLLPFKH